MGAEIFVVSVRSEMIGSSYWAWDGSGVVLATKWLESGKFACAEAVADGAICSSSTQLALLLDGLASSASGRPCREEASPGRIISNMLLATRRAPWVRSAHAVAPGEDLPADPEHLSWPSWCCGSPPTTSGCANATLRSINTLHFGARSERLAALVEAQMTAQARRPGLRKHSAAARSRQ